METIDFNQVIQENISVVEELLPSSAELIDRMGGIVSQNEISNPIADANITQQGIFYCRPGVTVNIPSGVGVGQLLIFRGLGSGFYCMQFYFSLVPPINVYERVKVNKSWIGWKRIDN